MNRRDHRPSPGLPPLGDTWEVALVASPFEVEDVEIIGLMLVAEAESGLVRLATPLTHTDEIRDQLIRACREPVAGTRPGRPARIHCVDLDLMARLHDVSRMMDIELVHVDALPTVREAETALRSASGLPAPGMTQDFDAWRIVLGELAAVAPWRSLHEDTLFTFRGGPLDEAVALVIGSGGESLGVVLYDSFDAYERFVQASTRVAVDLPGLRSVGCLAVHLERSEDLTEADVVACTQLGLALPGGRYPRIVALEEGETGPCLPEEQRALLAAVEGVTALCMRDLSRIASGDVATMTLNSSTGWRLEVTATPAPDSTDDVFPSLVEADHTVVCGRIELQGDAAGHPCMVFKLRKADALRLARQCSEVTAIELFGDPEAGLALIACDRDGPVGQLVSYPPGPEATAIGEHLASRNAVYLAISAGGPKRAGIRVEDFVYAETLPTRGRDRWL